jgi:alpha-beta hydrolase superfamily lysophospholipase
MKHLETTYSSHDGIQLYLQAWMPEQPKAAILLVHGLGEHSGRYAHFADKLVAQDISVFTFDGRGHGKSCTSEPTVYISDYRDYLKDIDALLGKVRAYSPGLPVFIFGHSMGGGLVVSHALSFRPKVNGIILTGALIKPAENTSKILIAASSLISRFAPKLKVLKLDSKLISHDQAEVQKYDEDPLVYHSGIPARTAYQLLRMMKQTEDQMAAFDYPVLILHGTDDLLTNPKGSEFLYEKSTSEDKTLKIYPGLYHELLNEFDKEKIMGEILEWVKSRMR